MAVTGPGGTAGHVFISYVHEDSSQVDRLQQVLRSAGIPVWRDTAALWPGEDWRAKIRSAITDNALVFIACISRASLARSKSYQYEELMLAIEQLRLRRPDCPWLIPVRFDECEIPGWDIGGGRTLASLQRADLFGGHSGDEAARLVVAIKRILGANPGGVGTRASRDADYYGPAEREREITGWVRNGRKRFDRRSHAMPFAAWIGMAIAVFLVTAVAGSAPWWWEYVHRLPASTPSSPNVSDIVSMSGGCTAYQVFAQNRWAPLGTAIRDQPNVLSKQIGSFPGNMSIAVNGWVYGRAAYPTNTPPWNSNVWFHLADGAGWVSFPGVRATPTSPDPTGHAYGGDPAAAPTICEGAVE
jgi:hypothetical protein